MTTYISISEMAKLHGITRQTLIHYDNIDLFKPAKVGANGYRYYCKHQIPYLREICFLKSLGISLKDIQQHFQERTPENEMYLLEKQKQYIMNQIAKLNTLREYLNQRIDLYEEAVDAGMMRMSLPFVRYIDVRQAIFKEWLQPIDKDNLHTTLMDLWPQVHQRRTCGSVFLNGKWCLPAASARSSKKKPPKAATGWQGPAPASFCQSGTKSTRIRLRYRPGNMCACISMVCPMIPSTWKS